MKASSRLTEVEMRERHRRRQERAGFDLQALARAHRMWAAGLVVPWRISMMLDLRGLEGPGVDEACGVTEPAVDEWEAGVRYLTWRQLQLLAILCDCPVGYFCDDTGDGPLMTRDTTAVYHRPVGLTARQWETMLAGWAAAEAVMVFTAQALAEAAPVCRSTPMMPAVARPGLTVVAP